MSVTYDGAEYFYLKNAQGDVTGLVNSSGTQVVAYTYDAWGNPLTTTGTMADQTAPFGQNVQLTPCGYLYLRRLGGEQLRQHRQVCRRRHHQPPLRGG